MDLSSKIIQLLWWNIERLKYKQHLEMMRMILMGSLVVVTLLIMIEFIGAMQRTSKI